MRPDRTGQENIDEIAVEAVQAVGRYIAAEIDWRLGAPILEMTMTRTDRRAGRCWSRHV